ncbi:MAG: hypothetical protein K0S18_578 [Anaerocolumna sp.]|nr:hypothetical protein [Anaerocolumna sp.]
MDPPYDNMLEFEVIKEIQNSAIVHGDTIIIIEASIDTDFAYLNETKFVIKKEKKYKTNKHVFLELK